VLDLAYQVLRAATPSEKVKAALDWQSRMKAAIMTPTPLAEPLADYPARPDTPRLVPPNEVKKRRLGSVEGRIALLHAIAHIEFNAIDLAADMVCRFSFDPRLSENDRADFILDWAKVCSEEAKHFSLIRARLKELGADYGTLPAHGGLWAAAVNTKHDIAARLAIAPMVLEARGLDVTPAMIDKLKTVGDMDSVAILEIIYAEEVGHVKIGTDWFHHIARAEKRPAKDYFRQLVTQYFNGSVKPPFNIPARDLAGLQEAYYAGLE